MGETLAFEKAVKSVAEAGYKRGQPIELTVKQLNTYFESTRFDDATMEGMMQMVDPTYVITPQDRKERPARRALSAQARKNFFEFLHKKQEITDGIRIPRGLDMLLDLTDNPGAKDHNDRVLKAFAINSDNNDRYFSDDMEERTKIMEEFLDKMDSTDFSKVYHLSDEQLAVEFPKLFALWSLSTEGGDGLLQMNWKPKKSEKDTETNNFKLNEKYVAKLNRYKDEFQGLMGVLKLRFEHMMDPNYELVHTERIVPPDAAHLPSVAFSNVSNPIGVRLEGDYENGIQTDYPLLFYSKNIHNIINYQGLSWDDQVNQFARTKHIEPGNFELVKLDGATVQSTELNSRSIVRMQNRTTGESFLLQADGLNLVEVDPRKALDAAKKGGDAVIKALENADPWHIRVFTGSKQFEDMKKQMKAVDEAVEKLDRPVSEKALKETMDMLEDLGKKAGEYLRIKGMSNMYTKDSERLRVVAGNIVQQYVEKTSMLLEANYKADLEIQTKREKNNDGMKKNLETEIELGVPRNITRNVLSTDEQETKEVAHERGMKLFKYYMKQDSDDLAKLGRIIYSNLDRKTTDEEVKLPREPVTVIARMVAYDIVMRERADNKSKGIEGPGAVEMKFQENPERFVDGLAKSKMLKDIVAGMKDADFRRFVDAAIGRKGSQQLTGQILAEQKINLQAEGQPKPEQIIQNQQQGPVVSSVPEPPKGGPAISGG